MIYLEENLPARVTRDIATRLRASPLWVRQSYRSVVIGVLIFVPFIVLAGFAVGALIGDPAGQLSELEIIAPLVSSCLVISIIISGILGSIFSAEEFIGQNEAVLSQPVPTQPRVIAPWRRSHDRSPGVRTPSRVLAMSIAKSTKEAPAHGASFGTTEIE